VFTLHRGDFSIYLFGRPRSFRISPE